MNQISPLNNPLGVDMPFNKQMNKIKFIYFYKMSKKTLQCLDINLSFKYNFKQFTDNRSYFF